MSNRYLGGFISATYNPLLVPNAPTIGTATTTSTTTLSIAFTAPSNVGGGAITSYVATAKRTSDGVLFTASGASSPITITGLTAVAFTVTVVAINLYGPSASSAASNSITPAPPSIGAAFGGGYFAGQIGVSGVATHDLVVGPVSSAQSSSKQFKIANTNDAGATSFIDGPSNSSSMNDADHPAAQFCEAVSVGGFTDWYMPARNELEVCYYNLKPTTTSNNTGSGTNPNAVPTHGNYTSGTPAQTSAAIFVTGTGAEAFTAAYYWSSTQRSATVSYRQTFSDGYQYSYSASKTGSFNVRAVRRIAV